MSSSFVTCSSPCSPIVSTKTITNVETIVQEPEIEDIQEQLAQEKTRLEMEIAEYRTLLDQFDSTKTTKTQCGSPNVETIIQTIAQEEEIEDLDRKKIRIICKKTIVQEVDAQGNVLNVETIVQEPEIEDLDSTERIKTTNVETIIQELDADGNVLNVETIVETIEQDPEIEDLITQVRQVEMIE